MNVTTAQLSPEAAAESLLRPRRVASAEQFGSPATSARDVVFLDGRISGTLYGEGKVVLLVHGWEGARADLAAFVDPLAERGFASLAVDLPGHGASPGGLVSIPELADALVAVGAETAPLAGVIAHSVGTAASALAVSKGLRTPRLVLVSPPANFGAFARAFASSLGFDDARRDAMLAALQGSIGIDPDELDTPAALRSCGIPGRILHSSDDRIVAIENARKIAAAWPGCELIEYANLGHRRILGDPEAISRAVDFIAATEKSV